MAAATAPNVAETPSGSTSPAAASVVPHPWSQVVRGNPDSYSPCAALPLSSSPSLPSNSPISSRVASDPVAEDGATGSEATSPAEAAWKRPINESVESGLAVIGGVAAWPALPESSKPTYKSPCTSGGPTNTVPTPPSGPVSSSSSPKPDLNPERGGGSSDGASSCASAALPSPPPILAHTPEENAENKSPTELVLQGLTTNITTSSNHSSRGGRSGSQIHYSGDHHRSYGSNRRWNSGGGSEIHYHNYASRRDQEHVNYNGFRRNPGGRSTHMQQRGAWSNFRPIPPPAVPLCSVYHPQFPNFGYPVVYPDMPYPLYYVPNQPHPGSMPYVLQRPVAPPVSIRNTEAQRSSLLRQIEYYFSEVNLRTDGYLQSKMDEQGWVPASLIAGFNRVRKITDQLEFILDTMRWSTEVEVKGDKMRKRYNWKEFLPKNELVGNISSSPVTFNSGHRVARMQTVELEGASDSGSGSPGVASQNGAVFSRLVSLNPSGQLHEAVHPNFDSHGQVIAAAAVSDQTTSGRSLARSDTF